MSFPYFPMMGGHPRADRAKKPRCRAGERIRKRTASRKGEARTNPRPSRGGEPRNRNATTRLSRAGEPRTRNVTTRPSRAGEKRSRQLDRRLNRLLPSFINLPWDLWAAGAHAEFRPTSDPAVVAKHDWMVRCKGAEDAYDQAVAEGDIDRETQAWLENEACRELAAFEIFSTSQSWSSTRSARSAWQRLSLEDRSDLVEQVDDDAWVGMWRQMEARHRGIAAALLSSKLFGRQ